MSNLPYPWFEIEAVFQSLVPGRHGKYLVCTADSVEGSITVSLGNWRENRLPEPGEILMLGDLTQKKGGGWRAGIARFKRLGDKH